MPTSRKRKHGSGKVYRQKPPKYDPVYTEGLTPDLRAALTAKLTLSELIELEKQLRKCVEATAKKATFDTHKTTWAITLRVLHDRFGFGKDRKKKLYDACLDYLRDIQDGRLTLKEMLDTLEHEDGIRLTWDGEDN